MTGAPFHTQYELSMIVILQFVFILMYWVGSTRTAPQTLAQLIREGNGSLALQAFRHVVLLRASRLFFGSMVLMSGADIWLTLGGTLVGGVGLFLASAVSGVVAAFAGLEGRPVWGVPTKYGDGLRVWSCRSAARISWFGRGRFAPVVWLAWVSCVYALVGTLMFVVAPRLPDVPGLLFCVDIPLWCVFWLTMPAAIGLVLARPLDGSTEVWPESLFDRPQ